MQRVTLGRDGPEVSVLAYGLMSLSGAYGESDDETGLRAIETALDCGIQFLDTAEAYGDGHNEHLASQVLATRRDAVVLATGPWANALVAPLGIELPTEIGRVQVGLFDRPQSLERHGVFADTHLGIYSRPEGELMLVGSIETSDAELVVDSDRHVSLQLRASGAPKA